MQDEVKVSQADREALGAIDDALGFLMDNEREIVLAALARHRHQAERETLARMEPVAWMYEYRGGVVAVTATRYDRGTIKALGYVETPLYALPPAPEAGQ